ncbi:GNAT family N-acetyltransferase [Nostoc cf. edaphicum LEGE 07299]|uniref:GNAT family N-acetyltransferase n=1 Tax=Nostoc cf. edaphicum LEGE 07299 TaxID=2777974 RepID=A0ABR9U321_9NOSO|nr:GNAT family N-acetyltransferase [Nostoc edaphicum]MBE9107071.1 GNAT family N-acetyltransferase [Nostoc cf. edaphicum LEGE 07299]
MSNDFLLSSFPQLETERLLLRETTLQDAEVIFAIFSDPSVTQFHDLDTFTSIKEAIAVIERRAKRFERGDGIRWVIIRKQDNVLIGSCGFTWNSQEHSAEVGYELASTFWRQGIMTEAVSTILQFGFEKMGLRFVIAHVMLENIASKKLLEKLGFHSQGIQKQYTFFKGQYHDLEQFVLKNKKLSE